jgi:hypothetical protein
MLSLTAKHFVIDMPDDFRGMAVHPPSWMISVEPSLERWGRLAYLDREYAISTRCEDLTGLMELLARLQNFEPSPDTAIHRSFYRYDFLFATLGTGGWERRGVGLSLNSNEDVGREPEVLRALLAWFAERFHAAAPSSRVRARLALWARPEDWDVDRPRL